MLNEAERRLLDAIDEAELTGLLVRLVRANSENPTGDERAVAAVIAEELEAAGIPAVLFGPGSLDVAHAPNEYVPLAETVAAAKAFALWAYRYTTARR
ncbi:hypothetical protein [Cohnella thermotolerans]|uniref:hypothetical protein n=1 Tax=Cohnella thermotolerans TaxID=329858 RepID=UPI00041A7101|nr:hypothetical protein [Cohnella thermotolerans]